MKFGEVPSMRCKGPEFFVVSTDDIDVAPQKRRYFRFLTKEERLLLQGLDPDYLSYLSPPTFALHVAGNAFSKSMVGAAFTPILQTLGDRLATDLKVKKAKEELLKFSGMEMEGFKGARSPHRLKRRRTV